MINKTSTGAYPGKGSTDCSRDKYTRRQINLYRMFFADFSVNSQAILMQFCKEYFRVTRQIPWNFH